MSNVRAYTDKEILDKVETLDTFKGWKKGKYDIWIRSNEDEFDKFDDKVYSFEVLVENERPKFVMVCTGTTNAGSQGLLNFEKNNSLGCAILMTNTIVYKSHTFGYHKGDTDHPAYIQSFKVGFPYTRDNDKDKQAENYGKVYTNRIGANCHRAGAKSVLIGGWSVACLVRNILDEYNKWLKWMNKEDLNVAILQEWND
jgi:hypothetical protein